MPDYKRLIKKKATVKKKTRQKTPVKERKKIIIVPLLILLMLIVALGLGLRFLLVDFLKFEIKQVVVVDQAGEAVAHPEDFFRLDQDKEHNLFSFDMKKIHRDIQARHPELAQVSIHKQFPNKLLIVVKERDPLAIILSPESFLVDRDAFILPYKSSYGDLPKIIGVQHRKLTLFAQSDSLKINKALELLAELKQAGILPKYKVAEINVQKYSDILFRLTNKIEVKMGQGDFARKAQVLSKVLSELKANQTVPKYIDMRFDLPIFKPK